MTETTYRSVRVAIPTSTRRDHDFGVTDAKGRKVGAIVWTAVEEYVPATDDRFTWNTKPGTYFTATPHASRNGYIFGATQATYHFETEAERAAWIAKYLKAAERRAIKSHGPVLVG